MNSFRFKHGEKHKSIVILNAQMFHFQLMVIRVVLLSRCKQIHKLQIHTEAHLYTLIIVGTQMDFTKR